MGTVLLLLVLAGWMGVGFWWFTTHRGTPSDATGSFRAQLGTLERRSPGLVSPAHRLSASRPYAATRPSARGSAQHRAMVARRRRDVLSGLALATSATFVLGVIPALRMLWVATVVLGALLAAYVYVLVQLREMSSANRSYSPPARRQVAARERVARPRRNDDYGYVYEAEPALVRRIAN
jgi:hypothetical protein